MDDTLQIMCPSCDTTNRVPTDKRAQGGKCGKCHRVLFDGTPVELKAGRFQKHLMNNDIPLLVDFWAPWCSPCTMMAPVFIQAARQLQSAVRLVKVNTEEERELAARYGITSIPTLILFKKGVECARISGAMDIQSLIAWARQYL